MTGDAVDLLDRLARALGDPVATPEWISAGGGKLERAKYRVFKWECPVCHEGAGTWRPLVLDSDGRIFCGASRCAPERIAAEIRVLLNTQRLLDSLGVLA